jgi:wyosine [tRNA(Phe)-imidazoG37] synthetase (radical SAM superfamily)
MSRPLAEPAGKSHATPGYRYLFGPVRSRRFGRSLGVDLTPGRTCSFDCPFCQLGRAREVTLERREYAPTSDVLAELARWRADGGAADAITLAGSGEPTLHTRFGEVLRYVRERLGCPAVLLSNGSLFWAPDVRRDAAAADIVKVSLSAWDQASFERVNRPHRDLRLERIVEGYRAFRAEFSGDLWLEAMLIRGVNDAETDVARLAALAAGFSPTRIQLNTCVRPPAEAGLRPVEGEWLERLAALFTPRAETVRESRAPASGRAKVAADGRADAAAIAALVARHPATAADVAGALGLDPDRTRTILADLARRGMLGVEIKDNGTFFRTRGSTA